jgi:hypothetical protein
MKNSRESGCFYVVRLTSFESDGIIIKKARRVCRYEKTVNTFVCRYYGADISRL